MQGSVRDPSREFPLMNRNQLLQHRNPAEHIEMINMRQSPHSKPGRNLKREGEEDGFLGSRVPRGSRDDMRSLNPGDLKNIITDWTAFTIDHPLAAKVVKYSGYFLAASAATGGSVLLSTEIGKMLRAEEKNLTDAEIDYHIKNFTAKFDDMIDKSLEEFNKKPNPGIFDIYFSPMSRVKCNDETVDFQFDFARVPPLPVETTTEKITHDDITDFVEKTFSYNVSDFLRELAPENIQPDSFETLEELPKPEKPLHDHLPLRFSLILIIIGAVTIVILAVIIACCFCYGCKSREKRYMNRDSVRAHHLNSYPENTQPTSPVSSRTTKSSQAPTVNLANENFEFETPINFYNENMQDRYLPSILGQSSRGTIGTPNQRRLVPYF